LAEICSSAIDTIFEADRMMFTDDEIAGLEEGEESESSDALWDDYKKHRHEAVSLEEYCRQRNTKL
jgi:hypothetical protein